VLLLWQREHTATTLAEQSHPATCRCCWRRFYVKFLRRELVFARLTEAINASLLSYLIRENHLRSCR